MNGLITQVLSGDSYTEKESIYSLGVIKEELFCIDRKRSKTLLYIQRIN
jgi:hypothetical protein